MQAPAILKVVLYMSKIQITYSIMRLQLLNGTSQITCTLLISKAISSGCFKPETLFPGRCSTLLYAKLDKAFCKASFKGKVTGLRRYG